VFAAYVSHKGHAFIDRALYLPKAWTTDPLRMQAAHVPDTVAFASKPALASMMIGRAITAEVPFAWVAADSVYGVGEVEKPCAGPVVAMYWGECQSLVWLLVHNAAYCG